VHLVGFTTEICYDAARSYKSQTTTRIAQLRYGNSLNFLNVCWWQAAISLSVDVKWRQQHQTTGNYLSQI